MAWALEMKNLASDIKTSTKDRLQFVKDNQKDTHDLLSQFNKELNDMTQDLKDFLDKSEKDRMADFSEMMKDIQARVRSIFGDTGELLVRFDKGLEEMTKDLKDLLAKSEHTRMADFKVMMKDIQSRIEDIQKYVAGLLGDYKDERKEAHGHWGVLRKKERAIAEEKAEEVEKEARKAKKQKAERAA